MMIYHHLGGEFQVRTVSGFFSLNFLAGMVLMGMYLADSLKLGAWLAMFLSSYYLQLLYTGYCFHQLLIAYSDHLFKGFCSPQELIIIITEPTLWYRLHCHC
jgi:hypothetical protein